MAVLIDEKNVFTGESVNTSTYTYNTSGWYTNKHADEVILQFKVATLTATSLTLRLEGKSISMSSTASANSTASLFCGTYTGAHSIGVTQRIVTKMPKIRLGAKIDLNSSPNNIYANISFIERMR